MNNEVWKNAVLEIVAQREDHLMSQITVDRKYNEFIELLFFRDG